ncbi:MAG: methyltransferase domain-containing protein [Nanoarchaeota archaeon]
MKKIQGIGERWENYRLANTKFPKVRIRELTKQLELTNPQKEETIVEVGTGNGFLTFALAEKVGKTGRIITYDYQKSNLDFVNKQNKNGLPITTIHQNLDYDFELSDESVDKVSTIATLHHYDDRVKNTGISGRQKAIKEFYRILKKGGRLVIGDIADKTSVQRHFDSIDNPLDCAPSGHPHDFLSEDIVRKICFDVGFKNIKFEIIDVPWEFDNKKQAEEFLHTVHNSKRSFSKSFEKARKKLRWWKKGNKFYLEWQLFYLTAEK